MHVCEGSNLSIKFLMPMLLMSTVLHTTLLPMRTEPPSKGLYVLNYPLFGHMWYVHPESSNQASKYFPLPDWAVRTLHEFSFVSSTTPAYSDFLLILARSESLPPYSSASFCISYNFFWCTLVSCSSSKHHCEKYLVPFWVPYFWSPLWPLITSLEASSMKSSSSSTRCSKASVGRLPTLRFSYLTWWWSPSGHNLIEEKKVIEELCLLLLLT